MSFYEQMGHLAGLFMGYLAIPRSTFSHWRSSSPGLIIEIKKSALINDWENKIAHWEESDKTWKQEDFGNQPGCMKSIFIKNWCFNNDPWYWRGIMSPEKF